MELQHRNKDDPTLSNYTLYILYIFQHQQIEIL